MRQCGAAEDKITLSQFWSLHLKTSCGRAESIFLLLFIFSPTHLLKRVLGITFTFWKFSSKDSIAAVEGQSLPQLLFTAACPVSSTSSAHRALPKSWTTQEEWDILAGKHTMLHNDNWRRHTSLMDLTDCKVPQIASLSEQLCFHQIAV